MSDYEPDYSNKEKSTYQEWQPRRFFRSLDGGFALVGMDQFLQGIYSCPEQRGTVHIIDRMTIIIIMVCVNRITSLIDCNKMLLGGMHRISDSNSMMHLNSINLRHMNGVVNIHGLFHLFM